MYEFAESERIVEVMFMSMAKGAEYRLRYLPVDETGAPVLDEPLDRAGARRGGACGVHGG